MFPTVLVVLEILSMIAVPASCVAGVVWWRRSRAEVGWRFGMSRVGVVLMMSGLGLCVAFEVASALGYGVVFGDPTRYAMWAVSLLVMGVLALTSAVLGKGWVRGVVLAHAFAIAFLGLMVAASF